jgi:hypothetical protein
LDSVGDSNASRDVDLGVGTQKMYIKTLTIHGFKSYRDQVSL